MISEVLCNVSTEKVRLFPPIRETAETRTRPEQSDPQPLPKSLPPVEALDPELLPEALRAWVLDIAHRMQCPPDFTAVAAITAVSSLIGARAVIQPKENDDWKVVPNLWGLAIGRPGVMKSPAVSQALAQLQRLAKIENDNHAELIKRWRADCKVAQMVAKQAEGEVAKIAKSDPEQAARILMQAEEQMPKEPTRRRYIVNDATVEKLGELLEVNPFGLLAYRDEMHSLLCGLDREGQQGSRGFYLTAYDGNQPYYVDRIGRGEHEIPRVCFAMLGSIQPARIESYVRAAVQGGTGDDGLLQRFGLTVWPDVSRDFKKVDQWPDTPARQAAWHVYERLNLLLPMSETEIEPVVWRFTPEAQSLFWEWLLPFETELRGDDLHPALISHLAKYRKLVPALALIFTLVDAPASDLRVGADELARALAWAHYLRTHAERLYSAAVRPETAGASLLLDKLKRGKLTDGDGVQLESFAPRQVAVKHWAGLSTPAEVRKAAEVLADYGWLMPEPVAPGSKAGDRYALHPMLLKGGRI